MERQKLEGLQKQYFVAHLIAHNAGNKDPNRIDLHGLNQKFALSAVAKYINVRCVLVK
jgi:hypothetical protein